MIIWKIWFWTILTLLFFNIDYDKLWEIVTKSDYVIEHISLVLSYCLIFQDKSQCINIYSFGIAN